MNLKSLIVIILIISFIVFIGFKTIKVKNEISLLEKHISELKEENSNLELKKQILFSIDNLSKYFKEEELKNINSNDLFIIKEK